MDLADLNNPHSLAVLLTPPGSRVLDVGCGAGIVAEALHERGCRVWGIDRDENALEQARPYCEQVRCENLERLDLGAAFHGMRFDVILFLDVLECLTKPARVLQGGAKLLEKDGKAIISLPNVTHASVRLDLLRGRFRYVEGGLLDRTHLRFFDGAGAESLIAEAGYEIQDRMRVTRGPTETGIPIHLAEFPSELIDRLADDVEARTYHYVFVATPISS